MDYAETVWADWISCGAGVLVDGGWGQAMRCSLSLFPNALPVSPMYSSGQLICGHLNLYITPPFCSLLSLPLGAITMEKKVLEYLDFGSLLSGKWWIIGTIGGLCLGA